MSAGIAPVSAVVPCFRCATTIRAAVASIEAQTLRPAEVVLVDDASGDSTVPVLHEIAARHRGGWVRVIEMERNGGPSRARNVGWQHARERYVAFLDADDSWHPRKLELQMAAIESDPSLALVGHRMNVQPAAAPPPCLRPPVRASPVGRNAILFHNPFPTASVLLLRDLPFRFDESRRRAEDLQLWARVLLSGYRCAKINQTLASWHKPAFGAGGLSGDLRAMNRACIEVRSALYAEGLIGRRELAFALAIGRFLYARRVMLTGMRRLRRRASRTGPGAVDAE